ncbi:MAG: TolC family protein [Deltaproteobacteria bacterium]|nr:TolC family protein [Deltaproteobacteria bacterium]
MKKIESLFCRVCAVIVAVMVITSDASAVFAQTEPVAKPSEAAYTSVLVGNESPVSVSQLLAEAVTGNPDLRREGLNLATAKAQVHAALGQFDVTLLSDATYSQTVTPQLQSGPTQTNDLVRITAKAVTGNLAVARQLETGGSLRLGINASDTNGSGPFLCGTTGDCRVYSTRMNLSFTHPLLRGFGNEVTTANLRRRRIQVDLAALNRQARALVVTRDLLMGYWELAFASRNLEIAKSAVELARKQLEATRAQIDVGRLAPIDAAAVERAIGDRRREVVAADQAVLFRSMELARLMGRKSQPSFNRMVASDSPEATPHTVDLSVEVNSAIANNPQLKSLRGGLALTELDIRTATTTLRPQLDLIANFGSTGRKSVFDDALSETVQFKNPVWSVGLNFVAPVQNRAAEGLREVARLANERAWVDAEALEIDVRDAVVRMSSNVLTAGERITLGEQVVEFARQNLLAEEAKFSVGRSTNNDVLLRQQELKVAESQLLRARVDLLLFEVQLDAVTGALLDRYGLALR